MTGLTPEEMMPSIPVTDWPTLIEQIRRRPGMFLGRVTLEGLAHFLRGIRFAEQTHQIPAARCIVGGALDEFEAWADERFNPDRMSIQSFEMARQVAGSDEAGFTLWFEWYDRFLGEG